MQYPQQVITAPNAEAARKLAEMNTYYDLQLKTMQNIGNSVSDSEKFQVEISKLGANLGASIRCIQICLTQSINNFIFK